MASNQASLVRINSASMVKVDATFTYITNVFPKEAETHLYNGDYDLIYFGMNKIGSSSSNKQSVNGVVTRDEKSSSQTFKVGHAWDHSFPNEAQFLQELWTVVRAHIATALHKSENKGCTVQGKGIIKEFSYSAAGSTQAELENAIAKELIETFPNMLPVIWAQKKESANHRLQNRP